MKISLITVCFNECQRIEATIRSVLNQTVRKHIEYIVIDGGSTDGTAEVLKKYADKVEYMVSEPDRGIYHAMNKGAAVATGDYLLFLNGGDYLCGRDVIRRFLGVRQKKEVMHGYTMTEEGRKMKSLPGLQIREYLRHATLPHQATFISRKLFRRMGGYEESFRIAGDYALFVKSCFEFKASFEYMDLAVAYFDLQGVSNREKDLLEKERAIIQRRLPMRSFMDLVRIRMRILKRRYVSNCAS